MGVVLCVARPCDADASIARAVALAGEWRSRVVVLIVPPPELGLLWGATVVPEVHHEWHAARARRHAFAERAVAAIPKDLPVTVIRCEGPARAAINDLLRYERIDAVVAEGRWHRALIRRARRGFAAPRGLRPRPR